MTEVYNREK